MAEQYKEVYSETELSFPPTGVLHKEELRPYVIFNMVASVDGRAAVRLSSKTDRRVMAQIRSKVEGVIWGGGTIRADPIALKLPPGLKQPVGIVWTRSGNLAADHPLFDKKDRLIFSMTESRSLKKLEQKCGIHYVSRLEEMLFILWQTHNIKTLLVEGGATFNHLLLSQNIGEEFFLTLAPALMGDQANSILQNGLTKAKQLKLRSVKQIENELYLRYEIIAEP